MYEHSCAKAGAEGCGWTTSASTGDELRSQLNDHVRKVHRVENLTDTIYQYLRKAAQR